MAVARRALPYRVRPKKRYSARISAALAPSTHSVWPLTVSVPRSNRASLNGVVREPSAPKKSSPRPTSERCTATETISSTSTEASASGW
jgi:hypothetical protein